MAQKSFYETDASTGYLREGFFLEVKRQLTYHGEHADFTPFLNVPIKDLTQQLKDSKAQERKVLEELKKAAKAWDAYGAQTLLLQKAIEYLQTPEVGHTANEWRQRKDGSWEISNLVYKMTFAIAEAGSERKLTWDLSYTAPGLSQGYWDYTRTPRERIEHEGARNTRPWLGLRSTSRANLTSMRTALKPFPLQFLGRPRSCSVSTASFCRATLSCRPPPRRRRSRWTTCWSAWRTGRRLSRRPLSRKTGRRQRQPPGYGTGLPSPVPTPSASGRERGARPRHGRDSGLAAVRASMAFVLPNAACQGRSP